MRSLSLSDLQCLLSFLALWLHTSDLCLYLLTVFPPCLFCFSLLTPSVSFYWRHMGSSESFLIIQNNYSVLCKNNFHYEITYLFPYQIILHSSKWRADKYRAGPFIQPHHCPTTVHHFRAFVHSSQPKASILLIWTSFARVKLIYFGGRTKSVKGKISGNSLNTFLHKLNGHTKLLLTKVWACQGTS